MTTKVAYTFNSVHRNNFMDPVAAHKLLEEWNEPTFDKYFGKRLQTLTTDVGTMNALMLDRKRGDQEVSPGGVIMSGTTSDLKRSFSEFDGKKDGIRGIAGGSADMMLLACFVRGKSSGAFADVKTLINIGPDRYWWGALGDSFASFHPGKWKFIPDPTDDYMSKFTNPRACWSFRELIDVLDRLEKPLEGEKSVEIIAW
jgi:hypothetical protein